MSDPRCQEIERLTAEIEIHLAALKDLKRRRRSLTVSIRMTGNSHATRGASTLRAMTAAQRSLYHKLRYAAGLSRAAALVEVFK